MNIFNKVKSLRDKVKNRRYKKGPRIHVLDIWLPSDTPEWVSGPIESSSHELMTKMGFRPIRNEDIGSHLKI